jgi:hypothetical protein
MDKFCSKNGKRCYGSRKEARRAMHNLSAKLRIYFCPWCKDYHFTKLSKPEPVVIVKSRYRGPRKRRKGRKILLTADGEVKYLE